MLCSLTTKTWVKILDLNQSLIGHLIGWKTEGRKISSGVKSCPGSDTNSSIKPTGRQDWTVWVQDEFYASQMVHFQSVTRSIFPEEEKKS